MPYRICTHLQGVSRGLLLLNTRKGIPRVMGVFAVERPSQSPSSAPVKC